LHQACSGRSGPPLAGQAQGRGIAPRIHKDREVVALQTGGDKAIEMLAEEIRVGSAYFVPAGNDAALIQFSNSPK